MRGFTLPVWVVAASKAAAQLLNNESYDSEQIIDFNSDEESVKIPIRAASLIQNGCKSIGICNCESSETLDITRDMEIWVCLEYFPQNSTDLFNGDECCYLEENLEIIPGHGVGKFSRTNEISISKFARELLSYNLKPFLRKGFCLKVEVVFPFGRELAMKTSNHSFGVVDGLALIGTQANVQISASPDQVKQAVRSLREICAKSTFSGFLTLVIGENGFNLALEFGLNSFEIVKVGNWIGPLLVAAAEEKVNEVLIFGYHGKLIKLAGGVFHTHHHLADNRMETLIAIAVKEGIPIDVISYFVEAVSVEEALLTLEKKDLLIAKKLWERLSNEVEKRSFEYVQRYISSSIKIGAVMFDRKRKLRWAGSHGLQKISSLGCKLSD